MGTTLDELVLKLTTENKQFIQQMQDSAKVTESSMSAIQKSVDNMASKSGKSISGIQQAMATMAGVVGGNLITGAFNALTHAAGELFDTFVVEGVKAAIQEEEAINRLNTALVLNGQYTDEASNELIAFAESMQQTTRYEDDLVVKNMALLENLSQLDKDGLKRATLAAADLASALGKDLTETVTALGKAAQGNTTALSKMGIQFQEGKTNADTFDNALNTIEKRFGGSATAQAKTFGGQIDQLKNNFNNLIESIGFAIIHNETLNAGMQLLNRTIVGLNSILGGHTNEHERLQGKLRELIKTQEQYKDQLDVLKKAFNENDAVVVQYKAQVAGLQTQIDGVTASLKQMDSANRAGAEGTKVLSDAQKQMIEDGKNLAQDAILGLEEDNAVRAEMLDNRLISEMEKIDAYYATVQGKEDEHQAALQALKDKYRSDDEKRDKARDDKARKMGMDKVKFDNDVAQRKMDIANAAANFLVAVGGKENKAIFLVSKAAAIAQSIVSTNAAAAMALASVPYPANLAAASHVKIAGYLNTAAIAATAIQGLKGGMTEVPGGGGRDAYGPVMLDGHERVVDRDTNGDLKRAIALILGGGGGGGTAVIELRFKDRAIEFIEAELIERDRIGIKQGA